MDAKTKKENLKKILSMMDAINLKSDDLKKAFNIVEMMRASGISVADVKAEELQTKGFDLLVAEYDILRRVPFEEGKNLYPIGIFPNASGVYISLSEYDYPRNRCDEDKIPSLEFFKELLPVLGELNKCLRVLDKPIIEGRYYTKGAFRPDVNWITSIGDHSSEPGSDYYGDSELAKYRPLGVHLYH